MRLCSRLFQGIPTRKESCSCMALGPPARVGPVAIATQLTLNLGRVLLRPRGLGTYVPIGNFPGVPIRRSAMRRLILGLTVIFLAPTALIALTAGGGLVGDPESGAAGGAFQKRQNPSGGVAGGSQGGFLGGNQILAKGDMAGTGGGAGGMMGAMKGGKKGGMHGPR